jgi:S-(hydroxymethyl)glutathione dehydrogenase / alcohol dehydrogenase
LIANYRPEEEHMKAAVCYEFGKPLVIEDLEIDSPPKGYVRVKVAATAICHSDIHMLKGELGQVALPLLTGHESSGYVDMVGPGVESFQKGDHVVITLLKSCGVCENCRTGLPHICSFPWPHAAYMTNKAGQRVNQMVGVGSFSEYTIVHHSQLVRVPDDLPWDRAALLGCGVITGFGAAVNTAGVRALSSVVVVGTGGVGLNSVQGAAFAGAYPVIAVDVLDSKLEAARSFGATHTVNSKKVDPIQAVRELTNGRGADYVLVTVGSVKAMEQGFFMSGPRGLTVMVGLVGEGKLSLAPHDFLLLERRLTSSQMGSTNFAVQVPKLVELYKAGKLKLDELISGHFKLDQINEAIAEVERGEALRNIIMF